MQVNFSYDAPQIIATTPSPLFVSAPGGVAAAGMAVTTATSFQLTLQGINFGRYSDAQSWPAAQQVVAVTVGGADCASAQRALVRGTDVIQCLLPSTSIVGYKNLSITIAGQTAFIPPTDRRTVLIVCAAGSFGHSGESCAPCPSGAICAGYLSNAGVSLRAGAANGTSVPFMLGNVEVDAAGLHTYPTPNAYWFDLNGSMASACPPGSAVPGRDVCIVPCLPISACLGNNMCAPGYSSAGPLYRCGYCASGFYRSNAECIRCPDSPAALVIGFVLLAMAGAAAAYWADKKQINVAFVAIGIDYAQV